MNQNPLVGNLGYPRFDLIKSEHIEPAANHVLGQCEENLVAIEKTSEEPTWENLLAPLEVISQTIHGMLSPVRHLMGVANSQELREAYEIIQPKMVDFNLRLAQSRLIYRKLKALREGSQWNQLAEPQQRIIELRLRAAKHTGIELEGEELARFNEISQELSKLATTFSNNVLDSTKEFYLVVTDPQDMTDVPETYLDYWAQIYNSRKPEKAAEASGKQGPWGITLDFPSFGPFMKFCPNRSLREEVNKAHMTRSSAGDFDNSKHILNILSLKSELAQLLGYKTYAELSVADKMADSVDSVDQLLNELREASFPAAQKEFDELNEYAHKHGLKDTLQPWDRHYYSEKLKHDSFSFTEEELRPYFQFDKVLQGLFDLVHKLFGVTVKITDDQVPTWNDHVRFYDIFNDRQEKVAGFYLDPFSRPENKRGGAWMDTCINRSYHEGELLTPVAYLVCNSTPPVGNQPALLTFREVETLFHEFGHGLQHMLTEVDHLDAAGINGVEWDAVELPSQFMENWCYHKPTIDSISSHWETGESLPQELFDKLIASKNFGSAYMMVRQLHLGMIDLELHHRFDGSEDIFAVNKKISEHCIPGPKVDADKFLCSFSHIFAGGYAAGYYSYKWAEVLSADAFSRFEEEGLSDGTMQQVGQHFKDTVLALGGGKHPMEVFKDFRGREPKVDALLKHSGLA